MKALTFHGKQHIVYDTLPDPSIIAPTDAIVQVSLCAICGSDLHVYHERETGLDHGTAMGHEFVGEVVETGSAVKRIQKGDRVVSPFTTSCGHCYYCNIGLTARCTQSQLYGWMEGGQGLHGGQAEYVRVAMADSTLVRYSSAIPDAEALLVGDILSTGYFCAEMAEIRESGTYAVIGCGPVGLMTIISAKDFGANPLFAIDAIPERLAKAAQLGARPINFHAEDPIAIIHDATQGRGVDAVMEAVGSASAARLAVDLVRPGGIVATVGVHTRPQFAFSPVEAYDKNLTYKIGRCSARHYMERLLKRLEERRWDVQSIFTHQLPLSEGVEAYRIFDEKQDGCLKVLLKP